MTPYKLREKAKEFDIDYQSAVRMRIRYLTVQLELCLGWMLEDCETPEVMFDEALDEIIALKESLRKRPKTGQITNDMIEQARNIKVNEILEFNRYGKATAWCHEDKRPSLTYMSKINKAWCPVCHKYFNAIDVQMQFTGDSFQEAVRSLIT